MGEILSKLRESQFLSTVFPLDVWISRWAGSKIRVEYTDDMAQMPTKSSKGAAGYDLFCGEEKTIEPYSGATKIRTGIILEIPSHLYGKIESRSGIALNTNLMVVGGVIDSDYRGEIYILVRNLGPEKILIKTGTRIAQIILMRQYASEYRFIRAPIENCTERGEGAFGSSGGF